MSHLLSLAVGTQAALFAPPHTGGKEPSSHIPGRGLHFPRVQQQRIHTALSKGSLAPLQAGSHLEHLDHFGKWSRAAVLWRGGRFWEGGGMQKEACGRGLGCRAWDGYGCRRGFWPGRGVQEGVQGLRGSCDLEEVDRGGTEGLGGDLGQVAGEGRGSEMPEAGSGWEALI